MLLGDNHFNHTHTQHVFGKDCYRQQHHSCASVNASSVDSFFIHRIAGSLKLPPGSELVAGLHPIIMTTIILFRRRLRQSIVCFVLFEVGMCAWHFRLTSYQFQVSQNQGNQMEPGSLNYPQLHKHSSPQVIDAAWADQFLNPPIFDNLDDEAVLVPTLLVKSHTSITRRLYSEYTFIYNYLHVFLVS